MMIKVAERNGFVIKQKEYEELGVFGELHKSYVVYHPAFDGVFLVDNLTLSEAEKFCDENDADECAEKIEESWFS